MATSIKDRLHRYLLRRYRDLESLLEAYPAAGKANSPILSRLWELRQLHHAFFPDEPLPLPPGVERPCPLVPPIETTFTEVKS